MTAPSPYLRRRPRDWRDVWLERLAEELTKMEAEDAPR